MTGILRDTDGDLKIENGEMALGNVREDVVKVVMLSAPGELKHAPLIGANLIRSVNGPVDPFFPGRVRQMLQSEHIVVKRININGGEIIVEL